MRLLLSACLMLLAFAGVAQAQRTADPASLVEARALMEKAGMGTLTQQVARATMDQYRAALEHANPGRGEAVAEMMALMDAEFTKRLPSIMDAYARIYTLHFTLEELRELNAFYDSAIGRKLVRETPSISTQAMAVGQAFNHEIMTEVMRALTPEMEKRHLSDPRKT
ncbi:MAG: DUF2059 domain-containing protein [Enhydrobacter sp.]|nr:MAG: DUF2059 domain-containing protein [Enhydrobacter sp.]